MITPENKIYNGGIVAGSMLMEESRKIAQLDPQVETWKDSTIAKLKQVVFRMLAEAKYIDSTQTCKLIPVSIAPEIRAYLVKNRETYVLQCMEIL